MADPTQYDRDHSVAETDYLVDPVYHQVANRLLDLIPGISPKDHIDVMKEVGRTRGEGITFWAKKSEDLRAAIVTARNRSGQVAFHWDNRQIWVYRLAALATDGDGYREVGRPSLHCAIGAGLCNIHIDEFGFVERGSDGDVYITPEALRHIFDELGYKTVVRPIIYKGLKALLPRDLAEPAMKLLDQTYVKIPSMADRYGFGVDDKWHPRVGFGVKAPLGKRVELRFEYTCGNTNCSDHSEVVTLSLDLP